MRTSKVPTHHRKATSIVTAVALGVTCLVGHAPRAHAAETDVSPTGKGIVGGALLGGEVVVIVESIFGVRPTWAYLAGAVVGAGGGGVGGYFIEKSSSIDSKVDAYLLAGGLGLLIPAVIFTLDATRYMPSEDATEDRAPPNLPAADPGAAGGNAATGGGPSTPPPAPAPAPTTTPPPSSGGPPAIPISLLDMRGGALRLGVPVPEVRPVYSMSELKQYGMAQQTELRVPLVKVTF